MTKKSRRYRKMENKLEIIGIDHGWSNIKTANTVFTTAVSHIVNEPGVFDDILEYEGMGASSANWHMFMNISRKIQNARERRNW